MGVRCALFNENDDILLIKHSYLPGWHMPGGGVEVKETCEESIRREVKEEACIELKEELNLFGIYYNNKTFVRDHVVLYLGRDFEVLKPFSPSHEIIDCQWFSLQDLPEDLSKATRRRIDEISGKADKSLHW